MSLLTNPHAIVGEVADAQRILRGHADGPDLVAAPDPVRRGPGELRGNRWEGQGEGQQGGAAHGETPGCGWLVGFAIGNKRAAGNCGGER